MSRYKKHITYKQATYCNCAHCMDEHDLKTGKCRKCKCPAAFPTPIKELLQFGVFKEYDGNEVPNESEYA